VSYPGLTSVHATSTTVPFRFHVAPLTWMRLSRDAAVPERHPEVSLKTCVAALQPGIRGKHPASNGDALAQQGHRLMLVVFFTILSSS
jgi:hypothetical protein